MKYNGNVGISTASPGSRLEVENTGSADDVLLLEDSSGLCEAQPTTTGLTWSCSSDEKLKENITSTKLKAVDYIMKVPLFDYTVKKTKERATGWTAQEMLKVYPELVTNTTRFNDETNQTETLLSVSMLPQPILIKAIQEQQGQIDEIKTGKPKEVQIIGNEIEDIKTKEDLEELLSSNLITGNAVASDLFKEVDDLEEEARKIEENATPKILMVLSQSWNGNDNANVINKENNIFYSGNEDKVNETIAKDFIFRAGDENNYKEVLKINGTSEEVVVKRLKAEFVEAQNIKDIGITKINGSIILKLG